MSIQHNSSYRPTKARIWLVRIFLVALTSALTFTGLEMLLNQYYSAGQSLNMTTFHAVRGWAMMPGDYWFKPLRELQRIDVHINEMGLRGSNTPRAKSSTADLVILGDSFVLSKESQYSEAFPQRLENLLNARLDDDIRVLNAGVPGYGTGQQLLLVRELYERHRIGPKVFLLMFFTNDILDNLCLSYGDLRFQPVRPCFSLDSNGQPELAKLPQQLPDYEDDALTAQTVQAENKTFSIATAWIEEWIQTKGEWVSLLSRMGVSPQVPRLPGLLNAWYRDAVLERGVPLTAALIKQMQKEIQEHGGELIVSMIPSPFQIYPETYGPLLQNSFPGDPTVERFQSDIFRPQRLVREMCLRAGVPFQDLAPILSAQRNMPLFIPRDGHLTHVGHRVASEALLPFVLEHMSKDAAGPTHQRSEGYQ